MKFALLLAMTITSSFAVADVYKIDTEASKVLWKAGKKVGSFHNGEIKLKSGTAETAKDGKIKNIKVVVDMKSISNEDLKDTPDYQKKLVGHLSNEDFFHVEKYPESTFDLESITPKKGSKDEYTVKGKLTMIGNTQTVEFPAKISTDKDTLKGTANIEIERLKWNLKYGSGSIFKELTADKIINDKFDLTLNLVAKKQ
ncbi:MAG: YceI family protein [Bdellovibrionales bacterium CG10_big_fil_rev_8_21_14_0_10_45_34]|nr:MAG: YceI family protein [Bdellovibrionales bacterium CG10_big_fil_rev_8_21_14_0_10_45_34]